VAFEGYRYALLPLALVAPGADYQPEASDRRAMLLIAFLRSI
jgi:hypothetical protein